MNKKYTYLLSFVSFAFVTGAFAADVPNQQAEAAPAAAPQQQASSFTPAQLAEMDKLIGDYLTKHPEKVTEALQAGMAQQQQETVAKMEKAVADNKDKLFKNSKDPIGGNPKGAQSLVVFLEPACGYCKKLYKDLNALYGLNKDVKVIFKDLPIMGENSTLVIKAMLAAKEQGKYAEMQKAIYELNKPASKKHLFKIASSLGLDTKQFAQDLKKKEIQAQIDETIELSKVIGATGTPLIIINETSVIPGFVEAAELDKKLKEPAADKNQKVTAS
jgi:protein-disulfide isomerase